MPRGLKGIVSEHIAENSAKYIVLILCFVTGIICGALFVRSLPAEKSDELMAVISGFCNGISDGEIRADETFRQSMMNNLRMVILLYLCGMSVYTVAVIYLHMAVKGFVIGFTVGFMALFFGGKGFLFVLVSVLPQSTILLPAVAVMSVVSHNFACEKRHGDRNVLHREVKRKNIRKYTAVYMLLLAVTFVSALVDTFVIPVFVKNISGLF